MLLLSLLCVFIVALSKGGPEFTKPVVGAYFPNWAQYRPSPYTYTPTQLESANQYLNMIWYGFAYFCPASDWYQAYWVTSLGLCQGKQAMDVVQPEPKDTQYYQQVIAMKNSNPDLKVLLSFGGWNFPSNYWSQMAASQTYRSAFVSSVMQTMQQYGFDGIDIDWEYPCSPARQDDVKISCTTWDYTMDPGGSTCAQDSANLLLLVQDLRNAFGSQYMITIATQADMTKATEGFNLTGMSEVIDLWNLMSYDYTVSDIDNSNVTAPNQPLYPPSANTDTVSQDSTQVTIDGYIAAGVPADMIAVGIAYYGHTWYTPGLSGTAWQKFGIPATVQGLCCGPFATTYGALYGKGSQLCGTYMYSEYRAAGFTTVLDPVTQSTIGYMPTDSSDAWTKAGTWISIQDQDCITDIVQYGNKQGLAGAFAFDISMDTVQGTTFTYELTQLIQNTVE